MQAPRHAERSRPILRLTAASAALSVLLAGALGAAHVVFSSQLALAQAADSLLDVLTAAALAWAVRVAARPPDASHPAGHHRAEPLAALLTAVVAGGLALEVVREALGAILGESRVELGWPLAAIFGVKLVGKIAIALSARASDRRTPSPALRALFVDARNDVAVGALAVGGFFAARYGWTGLDAWLALPVGAWIGWAGLALARENLGFVMGASVEPARKEALAAIAAGVEGVRSVHQVRAVHHGVEVEVTLHVVVDPSLTLRAAHDIGHAVEARLCAEPDISHAFVHVDLETDE
ncbi:MAG: cation transporter [Sandaracinaceae bacterium]|nr:cation transporter [Sandaracinaceae bacterium]